jgi:formate dehydrogenase iron-sulfur subunit
MIMNANTQSRAILIDITRCIGCHACEFMCKQVHNLPADPEPKLSATALTVVQERSGKFVRRMCMHCQDPSCAAVCPVGALKKTQHGPVIYESDRCIGCRYCMLACPFHVPAYEWSRLAPLVMKCDMCAARVKEGGQPACVEVCPAGATMFGKREEMLAEARQRIRENRNYVPRIYGAEELGGTSVLFLSDVPFEQLGFVTPPLEQPLPTLTATIIGEVPRIVLAGAALLSVLYWVTQRREQVALAEAQQERS